VNGHEKHELIAVSGRRRTGELIALLICVEDQAVVERLRICGVPTSGDGRPCRTPVRPGYSACATHGPSRRKRVRTYASFA
jgi:hypothetical protein